MLKECVWQRVCPILASSVPCIRSLLETCYGVSAFKTVLCLSHGPATAPIPREHARAVQGLIFTPIPIFSPHQRRRRTRTARHNEGYMSRFFAGFAESPSQQPNPLPQEDPQYRRFHSRPRTSHQSREHPSDFSPSPSLSRAEKAHFLQLPGNP